MRDNSSNGSRRSQGYRLRELVVGRLTEHGSAPYQFNPHEAESYYAKILTDHGPKILWGKTLASAITESVTQVKTGDVVGAQRTGVETFVFGDRVVRRNQWIVERLQFFADRARQARRVRDDHNEARAALEARPELKSGFLSMRAAEDYAARRIANQQDRERFLALVQSAIDGSIIKGTPLPDVRMRVNPNKNTPAPKAPERDRSRTR